MPHNLAEKTVFITMVVTKNISVRMSRFFLTSATIGTLCLVYSNIYTEKILFKVRSQENLCIRAKIFFSHNPYKYNISIINTSVTFVLYIDYIYSIICHGDH